MAATCSKLAPPRSARACAAWMVGPSAAGWGLGRPSSITSAPTCAANGCSGAVAVCGSETCAPCAHAACWRAGCHRQQGCPLAPWMKQNLNRGLPAPTHLVQLFQRLHRGAGIGVAGHQEGDEGRPALQKKGARRGAVGQRPAPHARRHASCLLSGGAILSPSPALLLQLLHGARDGLLAGGAAGLRIRWRRRGSAVRHCPPPPRPSAGAAPLVLARLPRCLNLAGEGCAARAGSRAPARSGTASSAGSQPRRWSQGNWE